MILIDEYSARGAKQGGGVGGVSTPLNFGWGVEHLSTPPDSEKIFFMGGWLPLNLSNYIVYLFLST